MYSSALRRRAGLLLRGQAGHHVRFQLGVRVHGGAVPHGDAQLGAGAVLARRPPREHPGAADAAAGTHTPHILTHTFVTGWQVAMATRSRSCPPTSKYALRFRLVPCLTSWDFLFLTTQ